MSTTTSAEVGGSSVRRRVSGFFRRPGPMAMAAAVTVAALTVVLLAWISLHHAAWLEPPPCRNDLPLPFAARRVVSAILATTLVTLTGSTLVLGIVDVRHRPARSVYAISMIVAWSTIAYLLYGSYIRLFECSVRYR